MADYQRHASHFVCGAAMFLATMSIAACGDALAGTYSLRQNQQNANAARMFGMPDGGSRMTMTFNGGAVDVTAMGRTVRGTYAVSGKEVTISFDGQQSAKVFRVDEQGCLVGGPDETYCKS